MTTLDNIDNSALYGGLLTLIGEVPLSEFVLLDLEASLEKLLSLVATDGDGN